MNCSKESQNKSPAVWRGICFLAEFVDHETGAELRLEPRSLRGHDLARVGDIHDLLHRDGIEGQGSTHLTRVDTTLEFAETSEASHEIDTLRRAQVADVEDLVENQTAGDVDIEHTNGIAVVVGSLLGLQAIPVLIEIE